MADRTGQQLGNYLLIRLLGQSESAETYVGQHVYLKTTIAIKVFSTQLSDRERDVFLRQAQTITHLIHPNIMRVLYYGVDGATPYLVMDYAPGGSLRKRHPAGSRLAPAVIVPYVKNMASGLHYAHQQQVIHRDVKPENLLIGRNNEILLSDFGISLPTQDMQSQKREHVVGTAAYMSPEQIRGEAEPASDQYSSGVIVYEWLAGERPFHGSSTELCTQHMFAPPPPLRERVPTIAPEIEFVVNTALAKDPRQRFGSMQAFASALEQASLGGSPFIIRSALPQGATSSSLPPIEAAAAPTLPVAAQAQPAFTLRPEHPSQQTTTKWTTKLLLMGLAIIIVVTSASFLLYSGISSLIAINRAHIAATAQAVATNAANNAQATVFAQNTATEVAFAQTSTSETNATLTANAAATASIIAANPDPYPPHGTLALYDPLTGPDNWSDVANSAYKATCQFTGNAMHITIARADSFFYCYPGQTFSNFAFDVKMDIIRGDCGGMVFRLDNAAGKLYFFLVCQDGTYGLYTYLDNTGNNIITLTSSSSSAFATGYHRSNVIAVVANHSTFTLYINGQNIDSVHDSTFTSGQIGLVASYYTATTEVAYSDARVWTF